MQVLGRAGGRDHGQATLQTKSSSTASPSALPHAPAAGRFAYLAAVPISLERNGLFVRQSRRKSRGDCSTMRVRLRESVPLFGGSREPIELFYILGVTHADRREADPAFLQFTLHHLQK